MRLWWGVRAEDVVCGFGAVIVGEELSGERALHPDMQVDDCEGGNCVGYGQIWFRRRRYMEEISWRRYKIVGQSVSSSFPASS
jgi:hypothetical protein